MQINGVVGDPVEVNCGVKQGCPLSPLLFGLLLDGLHEQLNSVLGAGVCLEQGWPVTDLDYVDDLAVIANSADGLQHLMTATHAYFQDIGLQIHPSKTFVMVFSHPTHSLGEPDIYVQGQRLEVKTACKYLGLTLRTDFGFMSGLDMLLRKVEGAWGALRAKYNNLGIAKSIALQLDLYKAFIVPLLTYGCEVWAFHPTAQSGRDALRKLYMKHLAHICGTTRTVSHHAILAELRMPSFEGLTVLKALQFWNKLWQLPHGSFHRGIAEDIVMDAFSSLHAPNVFRHMCAWHADNLVPLGFDPVTRRHEIFNATVHTSLTNAPSYPDTLCPTFPVHTVQQLFRSRSHTYWLGRPTPRLSPSEGALLSTYAHYMLLDDHVRPYYTLRLPPHLLYSVLRFRLGLHNLPVCKDRTRPAHASSSRRVRVARAQRICRKCTSGIIGDEQHMVFECVALHALREQFGALFVPNMSMRQFFAQENQHGVARFIHLALHEMTSP